MSVELNHTIVRTRDKHASAKFLADILGVPVGAEFGPFVPVVLSNGVTLDYVDADTILPQHYAFLVSEREFDEAFGRITSAGIDYYADPGFSQAGEINTRWGGRGLYFRDPDGHAMEILTNAS